MTRWLVALTEYSAVTEYTGGIGTHFAALLPAVVRCGIDVDLVLFTDERHEFRHADVDGVHVTTVRFAERSPVALRMLTRALRVRRAFASGRYDAVLLPEWAGLAALLPKGSPLVTNLATGIRLGDWIAGRRNRDFGARRRFERWVQDRLETRQIRRSRGTIAISRAVLQWNRQFVGALPPARIVPNCVDVERVQRLAAAGALPAEWPVGDRANDVTEGGSSPVIVFVGRLELRKGVVVAMKAFARLLEQHPAARLVLAGASGDRMFEPTRAQLLAHLAAGSRSQVTFLGHLSAPQLFAAVAAADIAICPSLWEGFGNVALEVKAIGTPLIVTTGSGYDDFCVSGDDCLMVAPGDDRDLADALSALLGSADARQRVIAGATASLGPFTPSAVARETVAAVQGLVGADSPDVEQLGGALVRREPSARARASIARRRR